MKIFLENIIKSACSELWNLKNWEIKVENTPLEHEGDFTFTTFALSKYLSVAPDSVANEIGHHLTNSNDEVRDFTVINGFLNISLSDAFLLKAIKKISEEGGCNFKKRDKKILVEFSSPNTNKPLHLGHLRNNFIGQSIFRILETVGYDTTAVCVVNDKGIHICKSMVAYEKFGNNETPEKEGLKGDKFVGSYYVLFDKEDKKEIELRVSNPLKNLVEQKEVDRSEIMKEAQKKLIQWEEGDSKTIELWEKMNSWVYVGWEKTYEKIGVSFDKIYYESQTYLLGKEIVEEGLEKKIFYQKEDKSIWVDLSEEKLDQKILMRSDGTSVYITQDLGMADLRYREYLFDRCIYVVGNEQNYHFEVLFSVLKNLGKPYASNLFHLSYGMIDLPSGKMKSREGTVVDADELIEEVEGLAEEHTKRLGKVPDLSEEGAKKLYQTLALGALKYQVLRVDPQKKILFNPQESIDFQGNTGPFIQYTHARICSVLQKAKERDIDFTNLLKEIDSNSFHLLERRLIAALHNFDAEIEKAAETLSPSILCHYVFDLCKKYNRFYSELSVLQDKDFDKVVLRLSLSKLVKDTIKKSMYLLGIDVPERM